MANENDVLDEAKEAFELAAEIEADNRKEALDDLRFARLAEQWPEKIVQQRQSEGRPCLTVNRLPAFIRQVTNDARQNKPSIKVHPADSDADPYTARIYDGLIRNIEVTSRADVAYDTALDFAVTMGFGYFRINTDYACEDNFDLDIVVKRIANPFTVYGDPNSTETDSSDWGTAFVVEQMPKSRFERKYKGADKVDWQSGPYSALKAPWRDDNEVLIAEYFQREEVAKAILLLSDQTIVGEEFFKARRNEYEAAGITVAGSRASRGYKVTQRIMSGAEVLETNDWPGKYIPVVPVYGDEVNVEGKRVFRGLVRDAKDAQRMFNFWRTASTELVALAPKAPFIGPKGAFKSDGRWATANTKSHAYLEYDGQIPPQRQPFAGVPAGALQEALNASDDMKAILGLYDASLGARSNETSGRAILARQREGDVSTFNFIDNLSRAIEHAGRIIIDLIPSVYTGQRIIRVLGPQNQVSAVPLNVAVPVKMDTGEMISHVYDLGRGKYDLTVETGPSFTTRREEAANQMLELIRAFPPAASVLGDLLAKNLDWPGADEISTRLQTLLPATLMGGNRGAANADVQKLQAQIAQLTQALQAAQQDKQLDAAKIQIDAYKAQTERLKAFANVRQSQGIMPVPAASGGSNEPDQAPSEDSNASMPPDNPPTPLGNPHDVFSLTTGTVDDAGWQFPNAHDKGLGWRVWVKDSTGHRTGYGHMDPNSTPAKGTRIEMGDYVGRYADPTNGFSTGPHVHVQVYDPTGQIVDPGTVSPVRNGQITTPFGRIDNLHSKPGHLGVDWKGG